MDLRAKRISENSPQKSSRNVVLLAMAAVFTVAIAGSGCVSVSLKTGGKVAKAEGVKFKSPASPFSNLTSSDADQAWQNKNNGNSIAYHSSCNDPADPPVETVQAEVLSALEDVKILRNESKEVDGRQGLDGEAEGFVDGVRMRTEVLIFKKNNCIYTLSYVGTQSKFAEDQKKFHDFISSFGAP